MEKEVEIYAEINPGVIAMAGNPIQLSITMVQDNKPMAGAIAKYEILHRDTVLFSGLGITDAIGVARFQINEVVSHILLIPELRESESLIENCPNWVADYTITASSDLSSATASCSGKLLYGRINNRMLRYLNTRNMNIFSFKFLNPGGNFTSSFRTTLYESEVMPLMGIGNGSQLKVVVEKDDKEEITTTDTTKLIPYRINITGDMNRIRLTMGEGCGVKFSVHPDPDGNHTLMEYRNTFGIMERFLCIGKSSKSFKNTIDSDYRQYEALTDQLISAISSPEIELEETIASGYLNGERIHAVLAMLASEEVYLVRDGYRERVLISCSDKIPDPVLEPLNLTLSITHLSPDTGYIPDLIAADYSDPRMHNLMYNNKFN